MPGWRPPGACSIVSRGSLSCILNVPRGYFLLRTQRSARDRHFSPTDSGQSHRRDARGADAQEDARAGAAHRARRSARSSAPASSRRSARPPPETASGPGAGPALMLSFVLTAIACGFTALCYAEFASMVPGLRLRLHLLLRDARGARRLDHRLGPDHRVRDRQRRGRDLLGELLQHASARASASTCRLADDRLHDGARERCRTSSPPRRTSSASRSSSTSWPFAIVALDHHRPGLGHPRVRALQLLDGRRSSSSSSGSSSSSSFKYVKPEQLDALRAERLRRDRLRRGDHLLRLHRLRRRLDGRRGAPQPAAGHADRHHRLARSSARSSTSSSPLVFTGMIPYPALTQQLSRRSRRSR